MLHVQSFLEQRFPTFVSRHRRTSRILARFLGFLFYESRFQQFGRDYPHLRGFDFVEQTLRYFDFTLRLTDRDRERIPASGRVVIVSNHPIGSLDGLALLHMVRRIRPDVKAVANELLTAIEPLQPVLLPVHNMGGGTPRSNLRNIHEYLAAEGALIIFPAGEVSRFGPRGVRDDEWQTGFLKIARKVQAPVLPVYVAGRNSVFFYSLSFLARPLSTLWLVREMFKQHHRKVDARVGDPVPFEHYSALEVSNAKLAAMFRKHVYRLAKDGPPIFQSVESVAPPENRLLLRRELEASELLGESADGKKIYLCRMQEAPCVTREVGRLRELTFRTVGEGTGLRRDIDRFDADYQQLVLWDPCDLEIAGAYRIGEAGRLLAAKGWAGLYTDTLFRFDESCRPVIERGLELGRSFVQPRYQKRGSLDFLWVGLGAYLRKYPDFHYLFGPVSISPHYGAEATARLAHFYGAHYPLEAFGVEPRHPLALTPDLQQRFDREQHSGDTRADFRALQAGLKASGLSVPTLFKHYTRALEADGLAVGAFNVDTSFGNCVDGFIVADIRRLKPNKKKRYLSGGEGADGATGGERATVLSDAVAV